MDDHGNKRTREPLFQAELVVMAGDSLQRGVAHSVQKGEGFPADFPPVHQILGPGGLSRFTRLPFSGVWKNETKRFNQNVYVHIFFLASSIQCRENDFNFTNTK